MTALTKNRNTIERAGLVYDIEVKAGARIFQGALVCTDAAGFLVPGAVATTLVAAGRAEALIDNTGGADGAVSCPVKPGVYRYANSAAADLITRADRGRDCFVVDDQTVARTNGGNTRSVAGKVRRIASTGEVWVAVGL